MIRTTGGDIPAERLGATNYHEHAFQVSPLLPGDELTDEKRSTTEFAELRASGFDSVVDATPVALGRRPDALARLAETTGLHVVATTGAHRNAHYGDGHWLLAESEQALAERFTREVVDGLPERDQPGGTALAHGQDGSPVRAGMLKAGIDYWRITAFERRVLGAVAEAHGRTGAPVMVHLEHGSAGLEVLELLEAEGVRRDAVVLAHIDRNPDPDLHAELAFSGAYLGYDGFARSQRFPDSLLIDCLDTAVSLGAATRIVLGGDVARATRYRAYDGMPGLRYLGERVLPRLRARLGEVLLHRITIDNPRRLLDMRVPGADAVGAHEMVERAPAERPPAERAHSDLPDAGPHAPTEEGSP